MTSPQDKKDFFISYNESDLAWARWISEILKRGSHKTLYQHRDFGGGANFVLMMNDGIRSWNHMLALLSPDYLASKYCQLELSAAISKDPIGETRFLIPIKVRECKTEGLLGPIAHIDMVGLDEPDAIERLFSMIFGTSPESTRTAPFPGKSSGAPRWPRFPGTLPDIWNVPHRRNHNFTGRDEILKNLSEAFTSGGLAALTQVLSGLGGVGKTHIALEYAYRHLDDYSIVWWLRAEKPESLVLDYAALGKELGFGDESNNPDMVRRVRNWLGRNTGWLLVFDNAENPDDLDDYLPQGGRGHTIVTSRKQHCEGVGGPICVEVMESYEATEFLLKRTAKDERDAAVALAQELGHLPLALEQAAAYIWVRKYSISSYLELYKKHRLALFKTGKPPKGYKDTVATTWDVSLAALADFSGASDLMNLFAFLAPEKIPLSIVAQGSEFLPPDLKEAVKNQLSLDSAIAALGSYSLAEISEEFVSVHRLVQAVVRERLTDEARKTWAEAALRVTLAAYPDEPQDHRDWVEASILTPHAITVLSLASAADNATTEAGLLLNQLGLFLESMGVFGAARQCFELALAINEETHGPDHPVVAIGLSNLGLMLNALEDLGSAKSNLERALLIVEAFYDSDHPEVARIHHNLGIVMRKLGNLVSAKLHCEKALRIIETVYGPDHPNTATALNNLAAILLDLGDLQTAQSASDRALRIHEAVYGPDDPHVASALNDFGIVLMHLRDLDGARKHLERALQIDESVYGQTHPNVARDKSNLSNLFRRMGDLAGARTNSEQALAIIESTYGMDHPRAAGELTNLGFVQLELGISEDVRNKVERALQIYEAAYGTDHPGVAKDLVNLAMLIFRMGYSEETLTLMERAIPLLESTFGRDHPRIREVRKNLESLAKRRQ